MAKFTGKMQITILKNSIVYFVQLLDFELWSILYIIDFDGRDHIHRKSLGDFCEPDSDANQ